MECPKDAHTKPLRDWRIPFEVPSPVSIQIRVAGYIFHIINWGLRWQKGSPKYFLFLQFYLPSFSFPPISAAIVYQRLNLFLPI
jgi:hypothetical protein